MAFVRFSSQEFFNVMASTRRKFSRIVVNGTWEEVYEFPIKGTSKISMRVFSSVDKGTKWSCDKGTDAIRIIAWDTVRKLNLDGETKTLRTTGWEDRLKEKIEELYTRITSHLCPNCGSSLIERQGRYGVFIGCSAYPACQYVKDDRHSKTSISHHRTEITFRHIKSTFRLGDWLLKKIKSTIMRENLFCPKCGGQLKTRSGKHGQFLGCSNYPVCNYTKGN